LRGHVQPLRTAAFDAGGARVVTASEDGTARVWEVRPSKAFALPLRGHTGAVRTVDFSPDGRLVVTASADATARIWDATTGKEQAVLRGVVDPRVPAWIRQYEVVGEVRSAVFSPDGASVLTASADAFVEVEGKEMPFTPVRLWDVKTGKQRVILAGQQTTP